MATHDDQLRVNISTDAILFSEAVMKAQKELDNADNTLKALRLDAIHTWLRSEFLGAMKVSDTQRAIVLVGVLFFIETGKSPSDDTNDAELYQFHSHLVASIADQLLPAEDGE